MGKKRRGRSAGGTQEVLRELYDDRARLQRQPQSPVRDAKLRGVAAMIHSLDSSGGPKGKPKPEARDTADTQKPSPRRTEQPGFPTRAPESKQQRKSRDQSPSTRWARSTGVSSVVSGGLPGTGKSR